MVNSPINRYSSTERNFTVPLKNIIERIDIKSTDIQNPKKYLQLYIQIIKQILNILI